MKLFNRKITISIGDNTIESPPLSVGFHTKFSSDSNSNVGTVEIYNLSSSTIESLKTGKTIKIQAGYDGDIGKITEGIINNIETDWEGSEKLTTITVGENTDVWNNFEINKTWRQYIKAKEVVKDIINIIPLDLGYIHIPEQVTFPSGKTYRTTAKNALESLAEELDVQVRINMGKIYFAPKDYSERIIVPVSKDNGLIGSPQKMDDGKSYKMSLMLYYQLTNDIILDVESQTINGKYIITSGEHDGKNFETTVEVKKYE